MLSVLLCLLVVAVLPAAASDYVGNTVGAEGLAANGSVVTKVNPVLIGGSDGTYVRLLRTDTNGFLFSTSTTPAQSVAGIYGTNFPAGYQRVTDEPHQLFVDPFDNGASLDTTNRWNAAVSGGGGVAASQSAGNLTLGTGTTLNGYSYLTSQPTFTSSTPGWIRYANNIAVPYPVVASTYMAWGGGKVQAVPSSTACPACSNTFTDAAVFEVDTDGKMYAAVYQAGVRTAVCDLSATTGTGVQPKDSTTHNYQIFYRPTKIYWNIDNSDVPVCTSSLAQSALSVDTLSSAYLVVQGGTTTATLTSNAVSVSDTAKNNIQISDGQYAWRKQTLKPASVISAASDVAASIRVDNSNKPTYILSASGQANTAAVQAVAVESGVVKVTRVRSIYITNVGAQTTPGMRTLTIKRTSAAGSTGAVTPYPADAADAAYSGITRASGIDGTAGVTLFTYQFWVPTAVASQPPLQVWPPLGIAPGTVKDLVVPAGITNGIAIDDSGALGAASFGINVALTEE
jgi:hypothetical protein